MARKREYPKKDISDRLESQIPPERAQRIRQVAYQRQAGLMVLMENVRNPHNLAAISRTCEAFGIQKIGFTVDPNQIYDPKAVGWVSSRSANKWLDYEIYKEGTQPALSQLKQQGWHVLASVADAHAATLYEVDFTQYRQLLVLVGDEQNGISDTALSLADSAITIPMVGMVSSLNVSVATALILAEITRQRRASPQDFTLPPDEAEKLAQDFMYRSLFANSQRRLKD